MSGNAEYQKKFETATGEFKAEWRQAEAKLSGTGTFSVWDYFRKLLTPELPKVINLIIEHLEEMGQKAMLTQRYLSREQSFSRFDRLPDGDWLLRYRPKYSAQEFDRLYGKQETIRRVSGHASNLLNSINGLIGLRSKIQTAVAFCKGVSDMANGKSAVDFAKMKSSPSAESRQALADGYERFVGSINTLSSIIEILPLGPSRDYFAELLKVFVYMRSTVQFFGLYAEKIDNLSREATEALIKTYSNKDSFMYKWSEMNYNLRHGRD